MTSFDCVMIATRGNWFQTNPLEQESDDRAGNRVSSVSSVCVTNGKDVALQRQIWSTFVTVLWFHKTEIQNSAGILVLVRVLWVTISKIHWQFWHSFFKYTFKSNSNVYTIGITRGEKWRVQFGWNQCQWIRDVCIHYDVSLYQRIVNRIV